MSMKLVRRPRSAKRMHKAVRDEVRAAYEKLGRAAVDTLNDDVKDWRDKPEFKYKAVASPRQWRLTIRYDRRTRGGKKYKFVDEGTGTYVGKDAYDIVPRNAKALRLEYPHIPKTMPASGIPSKSSQMPPGVVLRKKVTHPGIDPRHFTKQLRERLKQHTPGSFYNVTEAAAKRAYRKLGID